MDYFTENYEADPFNIVLVDRYAFNMIKTARLDSSDFLRDTQQYNDPEMKLVRFIESLGLNRKFKESKENKDNASQFTLAELFMDEEDK
jgi:CRISPR/Cas system-associated endonuclease Cas1